MPEPASNLPPASACTQCGGLLIRGAPICPHCAREVPSPEEGAGPTAFGAPPAARHGGSMTEAASPRGWMDINFGAPAPEPRTPVPERVPSVPMATPPAPAARHGGSTTEAASPPVVGEIPGHLTREERDRLRRRMRLIIVGVCSLLLLIVYFVLLARG